MIHIQQLKLQVSHRTMLWLYLLIINQLKNPKQLVRLQTTHSFPPQPHSSVEWNLLMPFSKYGKSFWLLSQKEFYCQVIYIKLSILDFKIKHLAQMKVQIALLLKNGSLGAKTTSQVSIFLLTLKMHLKTLFTLVLLVDLRRLLKASLIIVATVPQDHHHNRRCLLRR